MGGKDAQALLNPPAAAEALRRHAVELQEEFFTYLDDRVTGQDHIKRALAQTMYLMHRRSETKAKRPKQNLLFIGPTGCGKTMSVRLMAQALNIPFIEFGVERLTQAGYIGRDMDDVFNRYGKAVADFKRKTKPQQYRNASDESLFNMTKERNYGIIYLDEIDKLSPRNKDGKGWGEDMQIEFLKVLEGSMVPVNFGEKLHKREVDLDTTNITFIGSGAFKGLEKIIGKRLGVDPAKHHPRALYDQLLTDDLVEYGFMPEFIGRWHRKLSCDKLTREQYVTILDNGPDSPLGQARKTFRMDYGTNLIINEDVKHYIADLTMKDDKLGARALNQITYDLFNTMLEHPGRYIKGLRTTITLPMAKEILANHENKKTYVKREISFVK